MGRWTWLLLLLAGCATPAQPEKPLTAEETYEKIREVFLSTPTVGFKFWCQGRRPDEEPSTGIIASGNRLRIAGRPSRPDSSFVCNGVLAALREIGDQPFVFSAPPDFSMTLKKELLRGVISQIRYAHPENRFHEYTATSRYSLEKDETGNPLLSFIVYRAGYEREEGFPVRFRYDPVTFALLGVESQPRSQWSSDSIRIVMDAAVVVSEDLFTIPEDPKIRIDRTKNDLARIREALERYLIDNHAYPTTVQSLDALVREPHNPGPLNWKGPYLKRDAPIVDAWGRPYSYRSPRPKINPEGYDLWSWGWDGKSGNSDDLYR